MKFHHAALTTSMYLFFISYPSWSHGFSSIPPNNPTPKDASPSSPLFDSTKAVDDAVIDAVKASAQRVPPPKTTSNGTKNKESRSKNLQQGRPRTKKLNTREKSITRGRDPIISLNMNLDYLAKSGQIDAASRAEEMLLRIEALHADGYYEKSPDVCSYNSVMNAYAHESGRGDSNSGDGVVVRGYNNIAKAKAERNGASGHAERIMNRMVEQGLVPNEISYNTYLRCVAKDMMRDKKQSIEYQMEQIEKAESILTKMEDLGLANTISYNTLISILSKSKVRNSARQAEACLQRMMNLYTTTSNEKIQPDTCSFNSAIHAYANISNKIPGAVQRAKRTEELLSQMEEMYNSGKNDNVKPDVVSYSTVVNAYAKAACWGEAECAMRAMEILNRMEELHAAGDKDVKPNKRTYTTVINAFARTGKANIADEILSSLKQSYESGDISLKPDTICYSSVIDAYAKKGGEEAAERAQELLHEMENLYNLGDNDVKPNTRTYSSVITALGRSGQPRAAEKAEQILNEMEYISSYGAKDIAPNTICFNAVIDAYARSKGIDNKAVKAELILERMTEESNKGNKVIRPDTITFNTVINAAARSFGDPNVRKEAYFIGLNSFKTLHRLDYCQPSSITYVLFLRLLENLVDSKDSRDYMAEKVFKLCVRQKLVNDAVVSQLKRTCSPMAARHILSSFVVDADNKNKKQR